MKTKTYVVHGSVPLDRLQAEGSALYEAIGKDGIDVHGHLVDGRLYLYSTQVEEKQAGNE